METYKNCIRIFKSCIETFENFGRHEATKTRIKLDADFADYAKIFRHGLTLINTVIFCRRDEEDIRESGHRVAGHRENRVSGKGGSGKFWRCKRMQFG
jgi:hypothetical protein